MAAILNAYIDLSKISKSDIKEGKNGGKFYNFQIFINDETKFGNNVSVAENQSQDDRTAKIPKTYVGNGKVVWTDGKILIAEKPDATPTPTPKENNSEMPF